MGVILYVMYVLDCVTQARSKCFSFFCRLSGTQPFDDSRPVSIFDQIKKAQYSFDGPVWASISLAGTVQLLTQYVHFFSTAKHLISWLLVVNPTERLTAQKLMKHPWLTGAKLDDSTPLYGQQVRSCSAKHSVTHRSCNRKRTTRWQWRY